jgi:Short C-terminal domain
MFRKSALKEADARILHVEMLKRIDYGAAKVRVTYSVQPTSGSAFEVVRDAKVKMATLPQAGQQVRVSYDPEKQDRLEVLTPPGEETGAITERTKELPYFGPATWARTGYVQPLRERIERLEEQQQDPLLAKLKELGELRDSGVLSEEEFAAQKARLLAEQ